MKNKVNFKPILLSTAISMGILYGATSCTKSTTKANTPLVIKGIGTGEDVAKLDTTQRDRNFLCKAAEINLEEIWLGQLAQQHSTYTYTKELGQMMETDHHKVLDGLTLLAAKQAIDIPTLLDKQAQEDYRMLANKSGTDFDTSYCSLMIKGHKAAIDLFETEANETSNTDIRNWATSTLPGLHKHLEHATTCLAKVQKI